MSLEFLSLETIQEIARQYGYLAVFLGILLENLGIPLPGETVTLVGGFLAGSGELNYWLILCSAISGAFLGGTCGYGIGRYGGWPLLVRLGSFFRIPEVKLVELKDKFSENSSQAVFFGRFVALFRIFLGPMAGIAEMPFGKFLVFNLAGATVWASVMVTLAFFVGHLISLEQLISWVAKFTAVALVLAIAWIVVPLWLESRKAKEATAIVPPTEES
jgi:membrane protein DedA with SNARE-associated domain